MLFLADSLNFLEVGLFIFVCFVFAGAIWLFLTSMDNIKQLQQEQRQQYGHLMTSVAPEVRRPFFFQPIIQAFNKRFSKAFRGAKAKANVQAPPLSSFPIDLVAIKQMLEEQQLLSQRVLIQIDQIQGPQATEKQVAMEMKQKVEELELAVEQKDEEIQQLQAQQKITDKLVYKFEQVQQDFTYMQERISSLEQQAAQAGKLAVELEESKEAYTQVQHELARKSEKVHQVLRDNTNLHQQLAETEDKLQEANFQRQQLLKKVKLLEEINNELQSVTATNKKLQTEVRRIGELESMLNMITEERNQLLRK